MTSDLFEPASLVRRARERTLRGLSRFSHYLHAPVDLDGPYEETIAERPEAEVDAATVISSRIKVDFVDGRAQHTIMIDLDVPHTYVPSSTPGHGHLYVDVLVPWSDHDELNQLLARLGIVDNGWAAVCAKREAAMLRTPWTAKARPEPSPEGSDPH